MGGAGAALDQAPAGAVRDVDGTECVRLHVGDARRSGGPGVALGSAVARGTARTRRPGRARGAGPGWAGRTDVALGPGGARGGRRTRLTALVPRDKRVVHE